MWQPDERGVRKGMDTCICTTESLHYSPETVTTLLIGCTPIQNKIFFKTEARWLILSKELQRFGHKRNIWNPVSAVTNWP